MKRVALVFVLTALFAQSSWANPMYQMEVAKQPGQKWHFHRLVAVKAGDSVQVSGRLTSRLAIGLPRGHVDIAAYTPSGKLISKTATDYVPALLTQKMKSKGGVRFSVTLDKPLPPDAIIKVAFHREQTDLNAKPYHFENIAR